LNLIDKQILTEWYVDATTEEQKKLYDWLIDNKEYCVEIINALPIFNILDEFVSMVDISKDSNYLITTEKIEPIKGILTKVGFKCTDRLLSQHPLNE
jgi:hypothetical protein